MTVSVIIPTYNEEGCLADCLKALKRGKRQPDELIVADGMSTDKTVKIAKAYGAKVVKNQRRHAAGGRNAGIRAARGEIIAFIDADCIADERWLDEICRAFEEDEIDGLGTYIEPAAPANLCEEFWGKLSLQILMSYGREPYYVTEKTLNDAFITASCAYRRSLLIKLKGFSNYFGNNAEDIDLCWRALEAGARLKYVPAAKIVAHSPRDIAGIKKKSFRNGVSSSKLQKVYSGRKVSIDKNLYLALARNVAGLWKGERYARLFVIELLWHLAGKYYGSVKYGVINL